MRVWCATTYIDLGEGIECLERHEKKGGELPGDHCGRYWGILRLRESRNKSVVVLFVWDERGFNPGWRLGSQWER